MTFLVRQWAIILATTFFSLCLHNTVSLAGTEEDAIKARAMELCLAKKEGKWDVVYDMSDSAYKRTTEKKIFVQKRRGTVFGDCEIVSVTIADDGKTAKLRMTTDAMIQGSNFSRALTFQDWIKEDGDWYNQVSGMRSLFTPAPTK